ncbi:hypothetical protein EGT74_24640 [Chitinophaga lutea]|uniref:Uncharacterized protein n=2 Tax=Chitinophaga lutea TaxID=2488634 RepID=A0A3N4PA95_9BACT|nr:hypothetical protein EGT74_24640 [Chitinophaga lutea]
MFNITVDGYEYRVTEIVDDLSSTFAVEIEGDPVVFKVDEESISLQAVDHEYGIDHHLDRLYAQIASAIEDYLESL